MLELAYTDCIGKGFLQVTHVDGEDRTSFTVDPSTPKQSLEHLMRWTEGRHEDPRGWIAEYLPKLISDAMQEALEPPRAETPDWMASTAAPSRAIPTQTEAEHLRSLQLFRH